MNIITKQNFLDMLATITKKIQDWYKVKIEFIKDNEVDNWKTVVDFGDWVKAQEVLDFLKKDGRKMEKTTA